MIFQKQNGDQIFHFEKFCSLKLLIKHFVFNIVSINLFKKVAQVFCQALSLTYLIQKLIIDQKWDKMANNLFQILLSNLVKTKHKLFSRVFTFEWTTITHEQEEKSWHLCQKWMEQDDENIRFFFLFLLARAQQEKVYRFLYMTYKINVTYINSFCILKETFGYPQCLNLFVCFKKLITVKEKVHNPSRIYMAFNVHDRTYCNAIHLP